MRIRVWHFTCAIGAWRLHATCGASAQGRGHTMPGGASRHAIPHEDSGGFSQLHSMLTASHGLCDPGKHHGCTNCQKHSSRASRLLARQLPREATTPQDPASSIDPTLDPARDPAAHPHFLHEALNTGCLRARMASVVAQQGAAAICCWAPLIRRAQSRPARLTSWHR